MPASLAAIDSDELLGPLHHCFCKSKKNAEVAASLTIVRESGGRAQLSALPSYFEPPLTVSLTLPSHSDFYS